MNREPTKHAIQSIASRSSYIDTQPLVTGNYQSQSPFRDINKSWLALKI